MVRIAGAAAGATARTQQAKAEPEIAQAGTQATKSQGASAGAAGGAVQGRAAVVKGEVSPATQRAGRKKAAAAGAGIRGQLDGQLQGGAGAGAAPEDKGLIDSATDTARDIAVRATEVARTVGERVIDGAKEVGKSLPSPLDGVNDAREQITEAAKGMPNADEIRDLKEGDKITVGVDAGAAGGPGAVHGGASIALGTTIEKKGDKYLVTVNRDLGANAKAGKKLTGDLSLKAKSKIEYEASSPEEAAKIAREANKPLLVNEPIPQAIKDEQTKRLAYLRSKTKSIELGGEGAIAIAKSLGVKLGKDDSLGIGGGSGKAAAETAVKINMKDGRPDTVDVIERASVSVDGVPASGLSIGGKGGSLGGDTLSGKATATRTTSAKIPESVSLDDLARDPGGSLRKAADEIAPTLKQKSELQLDLVAGKQEHRVNIELRDHSAGDALRRIRAGDPRGVDELATRVVYDRFEKHGLDLKPGIDVGVVGGSVRVQRNTRRRVDHQVLVDRNVPAGAAGASPGLLGGAGTTGDLARPRAHGAAT
jgi:hypothetical protein